MSLQRAVVLAGLLAVVASCTDRADPREIVLVGRGMTFVLENDAETPNPVIRVRPGEQIRLTLRNEAPGLMHDFRVPAWDVKTEQIRAGQTTTVDFTVPTQEGRYEYNCTPHAAMMHGFVEVAAH